jgi:hypothetical protein
MMPYHETTIVMAFPDSGQPKENIRVHPRESVCICVKFLFFNPRAGGRTEKEI